ncbi:hypothetical protein B0H11DRAFT_1929714 [Mycena galericulata]|nr:hypothetical protein B0H11DRAFT_1929714 [Mycena galericulata]
MSTRIFGSPPQIKGLVLARQAAPRRIAPVRGRGERERGEVLCGCAKVEAEAYEERVSGSCTDNKPSNHDLEGEADVLHRGRPQEKAPRGKREGLGPRDDEEMHPDVKEVGADDATMLAPPTTAEEAAAKFRKDATGQRARGIDAGGGNCEIGGDAETSPDERGYHAGRVAKTPGVKEEGQLPGLRRKRKYAKRGGVRPRIRTVQRRRSADSVRPRESCREAVELVGRNGVEFGGEREWPNEAVTVEVVRASTKLRAEALRASAREARGTGARNDEEMRPDTKRGTQGVDAVNERGPRGRIRR